jgi:hypothetical protein
MKLTTIAITLILVTLPVLASGECPADRDDPIGQLLCGETNCKENMAWAGGSSPCRYRHDYWCCVSSTPRPEPREESEGFTMRIVPTGKDNEAQVWIIESVYHKGRDLWLDQIVEWVPARTWVDGLFVETERGEFMLEDAGECGPPKP